MYNIYKVENPIYQDYDEISEQYKETIVVMTDIVRGERDRLIGGIVRYYGNDKKQLINKWGDLNGSGEYGDCTFKMHFDASDINYDVSYLRNMGLMI